MREVVKDKGRIEHMMSAIDNVEEFTKGVTFWSMVIILFLPKKYGRQFKMICHF